MRTDVADFLASVGLTVINETAAEVVVYCPFHTNTDTPSFSINKKTGLWQCFNPSCARKGRFATLTKLLKGEEYGLRDETSWEDALAAYDDEHSPGMTLRNIVLDYDDPDDVAKLDYLVDRGYDLDTLEYFEVGYSEKRNRIAIPVRDLSYNVVGIIGRALSPTALAKYVYSRGFPRKQTLFNLQNARSHDTGIITEGSLDAIKVHQSGYPNVVATLGSKLSPEQAQLLNKHFDDLIIFSDNDAAGEELRCAIMEWCPRKGIRVVIYPRGIKDPGDMTKRQISECVNNAIDEIEYVFEHT